MVVFSSPFIDRFSFSPVAPVIVPASASHVLPVCSVFRPSSLCLVFAVNPNYNKESVWETIFRKLRSQFLPHEWNLVEVSNKPTGNIWQVFVDSAKVRFCCKGCGHGWTSMKGRVTFWCTVLNGKGVVAFRLYGQQCEKCHGETYEKPIWYPEEINKVLLNITHRIANLFYGSSRPTICLKRRPGKPKTSHNSGRCQACEDGVCALRR